MRSSLPLTLLALLACGGSAGSVAGAPVAAAAPIGSLTLDAAERRIVEHIDRQGDEANLALLQETVDINSGTMNFAGVRAVGDRYAAELEKLGFATRWVDGRPVGRAGGLYAERAGTPGAPKVILIGHLDTVFEPSSPFQRYRRISDAVASGPGVNDMKGGDVILMAALAALHATAALDRLHVVVALTGDEESAGEPKAAARAALIEAGRGAIAAIGFESGAGDPRTAVINRRSATQWTVRVEATSAHSSQIFKPEVGYGASFEAARVLEGFRAALRRERYLTLNPGLILAGTQVEADAEGIGGTAAGKRNVVAERAVVTGDIRALSAEQLAAAHRAMQRVVATPLPGTRSTIEFEDGFPPLPPTDGNRRLLAMYDAASRAVGTGPVVAVSPDRAGAADVSWLAGTVPMILDGVGMMGEHGHTERETADLASMRGQIKRAAVLLYRLSALPAR